MARKPASETIDIFYEKWYGVGFKFCNELYVLNRTENNKLTFSSFTDIILKRNERSIEKFNTENEANCVVDKLDGEFEFAGFNREVLAIPNYIMYSTL